MFNNDTSYYDERQIKERGKIFKSSFFLLILYNCIISFSDVLNIHWFENFNYFQSNFIGVMISITFCTIMMILKNAYISPKNVNWSNIAVGIMSFSGIIGIISSIQNLNIFSLIVASCIIIICLTYWIKSLIDKLHINTDDDC